VTLLNRTYWCYSNRGVVACVRACVTDRRTYSCSFLCCKCAIVIGPEDIPRFEKTYLSKAYDLHICSKCGIQAADSCVEVCSARKKGHFTELNQVASTVLAGVVKVLLLVPPDRHCWLVPGTDNLPNSVTDTVVTYSASDRFNTASKKQDLQLDTIQSHMFTI
jgi:hypothetical protein